MPPSSSLLIYCFQSDHEKVSRIGLPCHSAINQDVVAHAADVVVRWGKSNPVFDGARKERDFLHPINSARAIRFNTRKHRVLEKLQGVVRTPKLWRKRIPSGKLAVVRPLYHGGGRGFQVVRGPKRIPRGYYATEYIRTWTEYRSWFVRTGAGTGFVMCARRVPMKQDVVGQYPCRSQWGYAFRATVPASLRVLTLKAATKTGLDVGACDVLFKKGRWYLCELNSAPACDAKRIREFYAENLPKAAMAKYPGLTLSNLVVGPKDQVADRPPQPWNPPVGNAAPVGDVPAPAAPGNRPRGVVAAVRAAINRRAR